MTDQTVPTPPRSAYRRIRNSINEMNAMLRRAQQIDPEAWGEFGSKERQVASIKRAEAEAHAIND